MALDDRHFLKSAIVNFNMKNEIGYRNAVSRAYYSTYHKSLSCVKHMSEAKGSHHAALIKYLDSGYCSQNEEHNEVVLHQQSVNMKRLRNARNLADYKLDASITERFAKNHLELAVKIYELWGDVTMTEFGDIAEGANQG